MPNTTFLVGLESWRQRTVVGLAQVENRVDIKLQATETDTWNVKSNSAPMWQKPQNTSSDIIETAMAQVSGLR